MEPDVGAEQAHSSDGDAITPPHTTMPAADDDHAQPAAAQHPPAATKRLPKLDDTVADTAEEFGNLYECGDAATMSIKEAEALPTGPAHWRHSDTHRPTKIKDGTWRGYWTDANAFYMEWDDPAKRAEAVAELNGYLSMKAKPGRCPLAHHGLPSHGTHPAQSH